MEVSKMLDFYKTGGGQRLFDATLPSIARQLKRVADQMERANDLKEKELGIKNTGDGDESPPYEDEAGCQV
jgi:hypothetical protein